ncbi:MAG TPA: hypothetical protein VHD85_22915 [Terracidiphilus sp.]|nr:hypothetical protein [Terracidiphilus sp.]
MGDNQETTREDVEEILTDVLQYLLSGRRLKKQWFYIVHACYSYTRDVLAILVGLGLGFPGARLLDPKAHEDFSALLVGLPWYEWTPGVVLVLFAVVIRVYVTRGSVEKRAHLVDECEKKFDVMFIEIQQALTERRPLNKLKSIRNSITELVIYHTRERSYVFSRGYAQGADIEARSQAKEMCDSNENRWK